MAARGTRILFGFIFFVVLTGALAGGGAWLLTENRVEGYRATATLLLENGFGPLPLAPGMVPPGPGHHPPGPSPQGGLRGEIEHALGIPPKPRGPRGLGIALPDFATLISTGQMATKLKEVLAEVYTAEGLNPDSLTVDALAKAMDAETQVALQTRDNVIYRQVVSLHFTSENPAIAAAGANAWAEAAKDYALELVKEDQERRLARTLEQVDKLKHELEETAAHRDEIQQEIDAVDTAPTGGNEARVAEELRASLRELERDLARDEAALAALKAYTSKAPVAVVLELSVKEAELDSALAGTRAEHEYVAAKVAALEPAQDAVPVNLKPLQRELAASAEKAERLQPRIADLEETVANLSKPINPVRIAAKAITPEKPIGPHRYVLVGGAAALGAIVGMIVYFALLTLRVYARELDRA